MAENLEQLLPLVFAERLVDDSGLFGEQPFFDVERKACMAAAVSCALGMSVSLCAVLAVLVENTVTCFIVVVTALEFDVQRLDVDVAWAAHRRLVVEVRV